MTKREVLNKIQRSIGHLSDYEKIWEEENVPVNPPIGYVTLRSIVEYNQDKLDMLHESGLSDDLILKELATDIIYGMSIEQLKHLFAITQEEYYDVMNNKKIRFKAKIDVPTWD